MNLSEIKNVIEEVVNEELKESNAANAKSIADSWARFATENPEVIKQMREWVKDCQWREVEDESDIDDMTDLQIIQGVQRHYDGGVRAFIRDSQPTQPPQQNETTFKSSELEGPHTVYVKTGRLAGKTVSVKKHKATGVYYYLNPDTGHDEPVGTDQSLGLKQNEEIGNKSGSSLDKLQLALDVAGIEPTIGTGADAINVIISLLRAAKDKEADDRNKHLIDAGISAISLVPFADVVKLVKLRKLRRPAAKIARGIKTGSKVLPKSYASEGVGYVYSKDRAKDPKSIKTPGGGTEHWRIKFQSASDLKKHGNTEKSRVTEGMDQMPTATPTEPMEIVDMIVDLNPGASLLFFSTVKKQFGYMIRVSKRASVAGQGEAIYDVEDSKKSKQSITRQSQVEALANTIVSQKLTRVMASYKTSVYPKSKGAIPISKNQVREAIKELVDEELGGERLNEYIVPQSKPTPKTVEELWEIIDVLPNGSSISFYNSHNKNPNTTAPWVSIEKLGGHYNLSIEARMDAESQQRILHGFENLRSEDGVTEDEISIALEGIILNLNVLSMYYIEDYGHKHHQPQQTQQIAESKNMNKKELRGLIRESIEEIHEEQEDQQKLLAMKRIQAYAHWGAKNAKKHPEELQSLFERIVKDIDDLIKSEGTEVPIKHTSQQNSQQKSPLGVTEETISKTKHLLDQMLSQRRKK